MNPLYMLLVIPFFFLCMGIEWLYGRIKGEKYYRFNDTITNLNLGIGSQIFGLLTKGLIVGTLVWVSQNWAIMQIPNTWWSSILCLVFFDFLYYWAHRWGHEVNFFWGAHIVHHQSEDFNLGVALRQSWFHSLIAAFIFLPIPLLGFQPVIFLGTSGIVTLYQFWVHTEAINKLPRWFEYILNTPSHHRVHHARDPKYLDKNYAATFIVWDRIFGTFIEEKEKPHYGVTKKFNSWNPTWANFHYYIEMWQAARQMPKWRDKVKMIFAKPGWLPEEMGGYQDAPAIEKNDQKYNNDNRSMRIYVTVQFLLITCGLIAYMYHFENLSVFFQWTLAGLLILSATICGAILENKKWLYIAEYAKLIMTVLCLNVLYYLNYMDWFLIMLICSSIGFLLLVTWFTLGWKHISYKS